MSKKFKNRPQLWMRAVTKYGADYTIRLRIIYPDGQTEYSDGVTGHGWYRPCWHDKGMSPNQAVEAMHEYDKMLAYSKPIFLGYL